MLLVNAASDNQNLLRALEFGLVALLWLFFIRVIRAVMVEARPSRRRISATLDSGIPLDVDAGSRKERSTKYRLRVIEPEASRGTFYDIPGEVTVGRAAGCGVKVDDAFTSSLHARIHRRDGVLWVEDLGSTNGTWVNAERITAPMKLGKGDLVQVGGTVFEVSR